MSSTESITSSSMNACMSDYWYIWTFTAAGMVLMTTIDTVVAYFFLKKFFKTDKIAPKYATNKSGPAWKSSSDNASSSSARASPSASQSSFHPLTSARGSARGQR